MRDRVHPSPCGQFWAALRKNALVKARPRKPGRLPAGASLFLEIVLPAIFLLALCLPKRYLKPIPSGQKVYGLHAIEEPAWGIQYEGPAARTHAARVLVVPNTTAALELTDLIARVAACPTDPSKAAAPSQSFFRYFGQATRPKACDSDWRTCRADEACWKGLIGTRLVPLEGSDVATASALSEPGTVDAVLDLGRAADALAAGSGGELHYTLHLNHTSVPSTLVRYDEDDPLPVKWHAQYWFFANLQRLVDTALITAGADLAESGLPLIETSIKAFPTPAKSLDIAANLVAGFFGVLLLFAFLLPSRGIIEAIVQEKELRLRAGLRLLGLSDATYWGSWFVVHAAVMGLSSLLCAAVAKYPFESSSFWLLSLFLWSISGSLIVFGFFMSTFFRTARVAGNWSQLALILTMLTSSLATSLQPYGGVSWRLCCLLPPAAVQMFAGVVVALTERNEGLTFDSLFQSVTIESDFGGATVLVSLWIDIALYWTATWYLDKVLPSGAGQPLRWDFFLDPRYWRPRRGRDSSGVDHQPLAQDDDAAIQTVGLTVRFPGRGGACTVALDHVDLSFPRQRTTALLGRNGAGKTTAISVLTGLLPPTSGEAYVDGRAITRDPDSARGHIGICPQFDVLWPNLTVREHLDLFAGIKGHGRDEFPALAARAAAEVGLEEKLDAWTSTLSGGQRRKLSLALAFLGSPDVVFLDEPTSGMDPGARRSAWELVRRRQGSASVVLTTHFMEEADALADHVIIMADGRVAAEGSPLRLKARYGIGYILRCGLSPTAGASAGQRVAEFVRAHLPSAEPTEAVGAEVAFAVPNERAPELPSLLRALSAQARELDVEGYGLSMTTLERVFLRVSSEAASKSGVEGPPSPSGGTVAVRLPDSLTHQRRESFARKLRALMRERTLGTWRDSGALVARLVAPVVCAFLALAAARFRQSLSISSSPLELSPDAALGRAPVRVAAGPPPPGASASSAIEDLLAAFAPGLLSRSNATDIVRLPSTAPLPGTLDRDLLDTWYAGREMFGAAFLGSVPDRASALVEPLQLAVLANQSAVHALPASLAVVHSAVLRWLSDGRWSAVLPSSQPLPYVSAETAVVAAGLLGTVVLVALTLSGMASFSASFARAPVRERASGSKQLLLLSGASPLCLWVARLLSDLLLFLPVCAAVLLCLAFDPSDLSSPRNLGALALLLGGYSLAALPVTYLFQLSFDDEDKAQRSLSNLYSWSGSLGYLAVKILTLLTGFIPVPRAVKTRDVLTWLLLATSPHFGLAFGIDAVATFATTTDYPGANWMPWQPSHDPWSWAIMGRSLAFMLGQGVLSFTAVILLEGGAAAAVGVRLWALLRGRRRSAPSPTPAAVATSLPTPAPGETENAGATLTCHIAPPEDPDCMAEREHILHPGPGTVTPALEVAGLRKVFGVGESRVVAVRDLWLQVLSGQCFGLLGTNGAGKSTTFRMLVGEDSPDRGDVRIDGRSQSDLGPSSRRELGYCPQQSALPSLLTGREVLELYAVLRGVPPADVAPLLASLLAQLDLEGIADRACGTYSGGNMRKLSVAISVLAKTRITLMDEPSTGMDPASRRLLWQVLRSRVLGDNTIVLSSHSMEECEAVCGRVGIMAAGQLRCLGSIQHLKSRFGRGYTVALEAAEGKAAELLTRFRDLYPDLELHTHLPHLVTFSVPVVQDGLPDLVERLEGARSLGLEDYSVNQASLEQVFLGLTRSQRE